jgi:hypothetical protein
VKQKIGSEVQKWRENERNNEHDKIIQYFPQYSMTIWYIFGSFGSFGMYIVSRFGMFGPRKIWQPW